MAATYLQNHRVLDGISEIELFCFVFSCLLPSGNDAVFPLYTCIPHNLGKRHTGKP